MFLAIDLTSWLPTITLSKPRRNKHPAARQTSRQLTILRFKTTTVPMISNEAEVTIDAVI